MNSSSNTLPTSLETRISTIDGKAVICLIGRFDFSGHRAFRDAVAHVLESKNLWEVRVDLGGVAYLDSAALGMLLVLRDKARAINTAVTLANCKGKVKEVLDIAHFGKMFAIA